jgi:hypothetical protein
MTQANAHTAANVLLGVAGAVAGYVVLRNPTLRRAAWRAVRIGLTTTIPGYLLREATARGARPGSRPRETMTM